MFLSYQNGQELYYEIIEGDASKPTLVFLHEGLGCVAMWRDFPQRLCAALGAPGLIFDRVGYGKSSPLGKPRSIHYMHEYALNELPFVVSHLIPERDYFLVGHSDGGSLALLHAAEQPARLRGIITEAAHVFVEQETLAGIRAAVLAYQAGKLRGLKKYHGGKTDSIFKAWAETWLSAGFAAWNIEYALPSILCPALIMQGEKDQYGTAAQVEAIARGVKQAQTAWLAGAAHAPHAEAADETLHQMAAFLRAAK